ncbi:hypothetical protein Hamer_G001666 [Homarus americanus]|uniref:Uncharacterized protein n=1 Tax=Homarus americanus TaxID=6706 RepID=A0A8J5JL83_HOMAM|nr:hypothetical protein Hamer_G001666 [Homarus americanus]
MIMMTMVLVDIDHGDVLSQYNHLRLHACVVVVVVMVMVGQKSAQAKVLHRKNHHHHHQKSNGSMSTQEDVSIAGSLKANDTFTSMATAVSQGSQSE